MSNEQLKKALYSALDLQFEKLEQINKRVAEIDKEEGIETVSNHNKTLRGV